MRVGTAALLFAIALAAAAPSVQAEPTPVVVRVISQDAKFVGDLTGGARVVLRDAATGAELASGVTSGSTGDTPLIMAAQGRSPSRITPDTAQFRAVLNLDRPALITVEVTGPLGAPQTMQTATSQRWAIPGASGDLGDGWVVELPGLAIELTGALAETAAADAGAPLRLRNGAATPLSVRVQLMCGCPITPGGMWAAEDYAVEAWLAQPGRSALRQMLGFTASPGHFGGAVSAPTSGPGDLIITARNRITGNAGVLRVPVVVE